MATDNNAGLFATPEQYQQAQLAQQEATAIESAKLTPAQRASANLQVAGYQLGSGIAGALGAQDPQLKLQSMRQQVLQGLDQTNPQSMMEAAQKLSQAGDNQGAQQLAQAAREAALQLAKANQENTAATKNLREATPAAVREYQVAKAEGYPGSFVDFQIQMNQSKRNLTNVSIDNKGETAFAQELGKLDAKKVTDSFAARENAVNALNSLNKLAELPAKDLITGQFATGRVGATNLLTTLGLASPADANKLATSQQYQKVAGDVILQTLGGKLGSGFSNADREFIASLVPQLETNPDARRKLITFMQGKNQDIIKEASRLENYARANKGLNGFESKIPLSVTPSGSNPYSSLSDAELAAKIAAAQQRK